MKSVKSALKSAFFLGNYQDVVTLGLEAGTAKLKSQDFAFVVGALCFNGRKEEAERLYLDRKAKLPVDDQVMSQFFLGIAFCRHGGYAKARAYFAENLWQARHDAKLSFYAYQGLGFYHYFCAKFERARSTVEMSLASATADNFSYGRALASDLLGHSLIQLGQVGSGLAMLEIAENLAGRMGDGGLARSIHLSILAYRAQHGFQAKAAVRMLRDAYEKLDPQNTHARSNLLLEIANQHLLRGELKFASQSLEEASRWIYHSQHRRLNFVLSLKLAELSYHSGQYASALHRVQNVRTLLDAKHDAQTLLMALGLELKLLRALDIREPQRELQSQIEALTRESSRAISIAILARASNHDHPGEDAIATLYYGLKHGDSASAQAKIIDSGYLALLYEALQINRQKKILALGILGKTCAVFDQGEVYYNSEAFPKQLYRLLGLLCSGEKSKTDLVRLLWGYDYHPLQHDALIYQAVSRLRLHLGPSSDWIEISESGYRLRPEVQVLDFATDIENEAPSAPEPRVSPILRDDLNERQHQILKLFRNKVEIGVPDCLKKLKVSDMTLRRDFGVLVRSGLLKRVGKARATRYRLLSATNIDRSGA